MTDIVFAIIVNGLLWAYLIYCLIGGKKITYPCKCPNKYIIFSFFIICGLLVFFRLGNIWGNLTLASFILAAGVYHVIPSGFAEDAAIINGRTYPFKDITDMDIIKNEKDLNISFVYRNKPRILLADKDQFPMVKAYYEAYLKIRKGRQL